MTNPHEATSSNCFSSIIRRLLCTGSLPTHPSDHFPQPNSTESTHILNNTESKLHQAPSNPGIIARLMGLDSFPDTNSLPKTATLHSILRSRSVNYVDYLPQFELTKQTQHHHRRVTTSVSFREVPTFLREQNHDFFVLRFDQVNETKQPEVGIKAEEKKKVERNGRERVSVKKKREKEEKNKNSCKRNDEPKRVVSIIKSSSKGGNVLGHDERERYRKPSSSLKGKRPIKPMNRKEVSVELKGRKNRENRITDKNSSLGSISDVHEFSVRIEAPISAKNMGIRSARKKCSSRRQKYNHPCPNIMSRSKGDDEELRAINSKANKPLKTRETDNCVNMLMEVCRLTEEDTKGSVCVATEVFNFEEIYIGFGQEILEMLLCQLVHQLCGSSQD